MNKFSEKVLLVVAAKEPVAGMVKTRFSPEISPAESAAIYQCMIDDRITEISSLNGIELAIAFTPNQARDTFASLKRRGFSLFSQTGKDLGERLANIFVDTLKDGYQAVIIIDSDSPDLPKSTVEEAFTLLQADRTDLVLGPCHDGGYYLIGMRNHHPELFDNIPWSTASVLEATLNKGRELGLRTELLAWRNDLDTFDDLVDFYRRYSGATGPDNYPGQKTLSFLSHLERITSD
jgi:hypothetical protein